MPEKMVNAYLANRASKNINIFLLFSLETIIIVKIPSHQV
jgi:hypothetical protein